MNAVNMPIIHLLMHHTMALMRKHQHFFCQDRVGGCIFLVQHSGQGYPCHYRLALSGSQAAASIQFRWLPPYIGQLYLFNAVGLQTHAWGCDAVIGQRFKSKLGLCLACVANS